MSKESVVRKYLQRACPEWRDRLIKYVMTGDLDGPTSDHLDACPTCTAAVEALFKHYGRP